MAQEVRCCPTYIAQQYELQFSKVGYNASLMQGWKPQIQSMYDRRRS